MQPAVLNRLRPLGPWRFGSGEGGRFDTDALYRSDRLYSAITLALADLGFLEEWLNATARPSQPAVRFTSLFPYQADSLFVTPPHTLWPPPARLVTSPSPVFLSKLRWNHARFVPVSLVQSLLLGQPVLADQWVVDSESECLLRRDRPSSSPYRRATRYRAAVDRVSNTSARADSTACVEFEPGSGLWSATVFASPEAEEAWSSRLHGAMLLLSDTGFGAGRSIGWGHFEAVAPERSSWPSILFPRLKPASSNGSDTARHWLLSLYSPAESDRVDWSGGNYRLTVRGGRIESTAGRGVRKFSARLVAEGSVIVAPESPIGQAINVAPEGFAHPVYRSGFALSIRLPEIQELPAAEEPQPEAAVAITESAGTEDVPVPEYAPALEDPHADDSMSSMEGVPSKDETPAPTPELVTAVTEVTNSENVPVQEHTAVIEDSHTNDSMSSMEGVPLKNEVSTTAPEPVTTADEEVPAEPETPVLEESPSLEQTLALEDLADPKPDAESEHKPEEDYEI